MWTETVKKTLKKDILLGSLVLESNPAGLAVQFQFSASIFVEVLCHHTEHQDSVIKGTVEHKETYASQNVYFNFAAGLKQSFVIRKGNPNYY